MEKRTYGNSKFDLVSLVSINSLFSMLNFYLRICSTGEQIQHYENYDLENLETPLDVNKYQQLLFESDYDKVEADFLVDGFRNGFDIGYKGPEICQSQSRNIPFTVGNHTDMWNKIMKEVKLKRVTGPFETIPFENYIQSPIGLVPKTGNKTRLIFHLSYNFNKDEDNSVNACTPRDLCTVKYNNLDAAIAACLETSKQAEIVNGTSVIYLGKTDLTSD